MARLQDFQTVTPSAANDNLLIVQAAGQGLAKIDSVGQKIANDTTISSLNTTSKKIAGAINENKQAIGTKLDTSRIRLGKASYSGLKGGGFADRVSVQITFDTPFADTNYVVFAVVNNAYADFPYISVYAFDRLTSGFRATCLNMSGSSTAVSGEFDWLVIHL